MVIRVDIRRLAPRGQPKNIVKGHSATVMEDRPKKRRIGANDFGGTRGVACRRGKDYCVRRQEGVRLGCWTHKNRNGTDL